MTPLPFQTMYNYKITKTSISHKKLLSLDPITDPCTAYITRCLLSELYKKPGVGGWEFISITVVHTTV